MSFQAYLDNIREKTGKTPDDFHALAKADGVLAPGMTATQLTDWLKTKFGLGHGHAMAIWAVFKQKGWAGAPTSKGAAKSAKKPK
ncbi:MAG: DUF4287 domain-containing protein [Beijerinckiaceae bacterium]